MSYYRSMPISQLIAGLNDANELVNQGNMSDEDMDALTDRLTAEAQMLTSLDDERERLEQEGIGQQDLHRLESISPGVTAGLNSGDYTFLASQHGLEPALNAIDWGMIGRWGIVGAIIAAIIALIVKIKGGRDKGKEKIESVIEAVKKEYADNVDELNKEIAIKNKKFEERNEILKRKEEELRKQGVHVPPPPSERKFNVKMAVEKIQGRFKNSSEGEPKEADILKYLPISEFQKLDKPEEVDDTSAGKIYSFCYHFGLSKEAKERFMAFDTMYGSPSAFSATIQKILNEDLRSSTVLGDTLNAMTIAIKELDGIYKDDFTPAQYNEWTNKSFGSSGATIRFSEIATAIKKELVENREESNIKEIIDGSVKLSMTMTDKNGGFYDFKNISKPEYRDGDELRSRILKHLDLVEKNEKDLESRVKEFERITKSIIERKISGGTESEKASRLVNARLSQANSAIIGYYKNALASVQGCNTYIHYGDVGVETCRSLRKHSLGVIKTLLECYE